MFGSRIIDSDKKIGYLAVSSFQEDTTEELEKAVTDLLQKEMEALILDLRFNPGGLLNVAVDVSDKFLEDDIIVYTKGKDASQNQMYYAKKQGTFPNFPVIVLINNGSASAAEIVAAAIRDNKRGLLVGTKTFGKGSVQSLVPVEGGGSAIKLTTAKYYTPSGTLIHKVGIEPDIVVELDKEQTRKLHKFMATLKNTKSPGADDGQEGAPTEEEPIDIQLVRESFPDRI